jgi:hypothetical protein
MTKTLNQKPTEHDIHLKYLCSHCGETHWLSFLEASTKNFKIVCCCGNTFKVKRVDGFKLKYANRKKKSTVVQHTTNPMVSNSLTEQEIPIDLLHNCVKILIGYGYDKQESIELLSSTYRKNPVDSVSSLVKQTLASLKDL